MATFLDCPLFDSAPRNIGAFTATRSSLLGPAPSPIVAAVSLLPVSPFSAPAPAPPLPRESPPPRVPLPGDPSDDTGPMFTPLPAFVPQGTLPAYSPAVQLVMKRSSLLPVNSLDYGSSAPPAANPPPVDRPDPRDQAAGDGVGIEDRMYLPPRIILKDPPGSTEPPIYVKGAGIEDRLYPPAPAAGPSPAVLIAGGVALAAVVGGFLFVLRRK